MSLSAILSHAVGPVAIHEHGHGLKSPKIRCNRPLTFENQRRTYADAQNSHRETTSRKSCMINEQPGSFSR